MESSVEVGDGEITVVEGSHLEVNHVLALVVIEPIDAGGLTSVEAESLKEDKLNSVGFALFDAEFWLTVDNISDVLAGV